MARICKINALPAATLGLALLGAIAFGAGLKNPLIFDDAAIIEGNRWLEVVNVPRFFRSFLPDSGLSFPGYRPLLMTTFALERGLFQSDAGMRFTNLALHIAMSVLVFLLARHAVVKVFSKNVILVPFFIAATFLLHPVQTNVIALIWKRSDLLVGLGILGAFLVSGRWLEKRGWGNLILVYLFALIATFSKESALILVPLLFLGERLFWSNRRTIRERLACLYGPLAGLAFAHAWILFQVMPRVLSTVGYRIDPMVPPSLQIDRWAYFQTQAACLLEYFQILFVPSVLAVFHEIPPVDSLLDPRLLLGAFVAVSALLCAVALRRRHPMVSFSVFWFFLLLAPTSSFVPLSMPFDEDRLYLPMVGVALLIGLVGAICAQRIQKTYLKKSIGITAVAICALYIGIDRNRLRVWNDPLHLWWENTMTAPNDPRPWISFAQTLEGRGKREAALAAYERASQLEPDYPYLMLRRGTLLAGFDDGERGEPLLGRVVRSGVFVSEAFDQLGILYARQRRWDEGAKAFVRGLQSNPHDVTVLRNFSLFLDQIGEGEHSLRALRLAAIVDPGDPETLIRLSRQLLRVRKDLEGARYFLTEAARARPGDARLGALRSEIEKK